MKLQRIPRPSRRRGLSLRTKTVALFAALVAVVIGLAAMFGVATHQATESQRDLLALTKWRYMSVEIQSSVGDQVGDLYTFPRPAAVQQEYHDEGTRVASLLNQMSALSVALTSRPQLAAFAPATRSWESFADGVMASSSSPRAMDSAIQPHLDAWQSVEQGLNPVLDAEIDRVTNAEQERFVMQTRATELLGLLGALLVVLLAAIVLRSTLGPILSLSRAADQLSRGANADIPVLRRDDEIGRLGNALHAWQSTTRRRLDLAQAMIHLDGSVDLRDLLALSLEHLIEITGAAQVMVATIRDGRLAAAAAAPMDAAAYEATFMRSPRSVDPAAFGKQGPVWLDLASRPAGDADIDRARELGYGPLLAIPLISGAEMIGLALCMRYAGAPNFTAADAQACEVVTTPLAFALRVSTAFAELVRTNASLDQANRHKSDFLARMSHELRTPLNAILGFSEVLLDEPAGRRDRSTEVAWLEEIHTSGEHLLGLVNDVLDLSKVEAGKATVEVAELDLASVIDQVVSNLSTLARQKSIEVASVGDQPLHMLSDGAKLRQVLINLLSNAIKFTPAGGRVTLAASTTERAVRVSVRDTGPGIAAQDRDRLFRAFEQVNPANHAESGTGLGLALSRELIELLGGRIGVESEPGAGSDFWIEVPVVWPGVGAAEMVGVAESAGREAA